MSYNDEVFLTIRGERHYLWRAVVRTVVCFLFKEAYVKYLRLWFSVIFRARKCGIVRKKLPYKYLQLFKKRVHVPHHVITRSSRLLSGAGEPNRGSHYDHHLCHDIERLLP
jgi:hypothetical protein